MTSLCYALAQNISRKTASGLLLLAFVAQSYQVQADDIQLSLRETDLLAVLEYYSELTGKVFVPDSAVGGTVTILTPTPVSRKQAISLLFSILDTKGFAIVEVDDYYRVVQKAEAFQSSSAAYSKSTAGDLIVTDVIKPKYVNVDGLRESLRQLLSPEAKLVVNSDFNFLIVTDKAGNIRKLRQVLGRMDLPVAQPVTKTYRLQYTPVKDIEATMQALLDSSVTNDEDSGGFQEFSSGAPTGPNNKVLADVRTNSLIITAPEGLQNIAVATIERLDLRSPQVLIEAKIVEINLDENSKLGVQWQSFLNGSDWSGVVGLTGADTIVNPSELLALPGPQQGLSAALLSTNNYSAFLNLLATDTRAQVLSAPHLIASNNQEARLRVGDEIPILKELRLDANNNPIRTFDRENVGLELAITPSIAENRDVSMQVAFQVSSVIDSALDGNDFTVAEREVNTHVVVKDRQTLVISGLIREDSSADTSGIPKLKDAGPLGYVFGSKNDRIVKRELLILITPRVIQSAEEADNVGESQAAKYPEAVNAGAIYQQMQEFDL